MPWLFQKGGGEALIEALKKRDGDSEQRELEKLFSIFRQALARFLARWRLISAHVSCLGRYRALLGWNCFPCVEGRTGFECSNPCGLDVRVLLLPELNVRFALQSRNLDLLFRVRRLKLLRLLQVM